MQRLSLSFITALALASSGCILFDGGDDDDDDHGHIDQTLFVAHEGTLVSYDAMTGEERPGSVLSVNGPVDIQALSDGHLLVNLTAVNEVLVVDGHTMLEVARFPSSTEGGTRPVHSLITPDRRRWLTLNDGDGTLATNRALIVDIEEGSATRFQPVAEFALGNGHHKASFSLDSTRAAISNISDCQNVMGVYDLTSPGAAIATLTSGDLGFYGPVDCDPTFANGFPPAPHGCATSPDSGKGYCNITGTGQIAIVDYDVPSFTLVSTSNGGGGYTNFHPDGRYVYSLQETPREYSEFGGPGPVCRIGTLLVIDSTTDTIVTQLPIGYDGPGCTTVLTGTPAQTAYPGHVLFTHDGAKAYVQVAGGFGVTSARVARQVVLDTSDPAAPVQLPSLTIGESSGHHSDTISGDGQWLFVTNNEDGTVSRIEIATDTVTTFQVEALPRTLATFGDHEGPSHQTGPLTLPPHGDE